MLGKGYGIAEYLRALFVPKRLNLIHSYGIKISLISTVIDDKEHLPVVSVIVGPLKGCFVYFVANVKSLNVQNSCSTNHGFTETTWKFTDRASFGSVTIQRAIKTVKQWMRTVQNRAQEEIVRLIVVRNSVRQGTKKKVL